MVCKVLLLLPKLWADLTAFPQELPFSRALLLLPRIWDQGKARMWSLSWGSQGLPRMGLKNILVLWPRSKEAPGNGVLRLRQVWRSWGLGSRT